MAPRVADAHFPACPAPGLTLDAHFMSMSSEENAVPALSIAERLRMALQDVLTLRPEVAATLTEDTPLFGAMPELDSMAVATLLTDIEDRFGIIIDDDDVDGEIFETFGALAAFIEGKLAASA